MNLVLQALRRGREGLDLGRLPLVLGQNVKVGNSVFPGGQPPVDYARGVAESAAVRRALRDHRMRLGVSPEAEAEVLEASAGIGSAVHEELTRTLAEVVDEPDRRRPFHWQLDFPEVFDPDLPAESQGFDVVVGNPPWIGFTGATEDRPYLRQHYATTVGRFDVYVPFIELGVSLLREGGAFGMIVPSNFFLRDYGDELRPYLRQNTTIQQVIDFAENQIFAGATNYPTILLLNRRLAADDHELLYMRKTYEEQRGRRHRQADLDDAGWVFLTIEESELFTQLRRAETTLGSVCRVENDSGLAEGVISGQNKVFLLDAPAAQEVGLEADLLHPAVKGEDVQRWSIPAPQRVLIYPYRNGEVLDEHELAQCERIYRWLCHWQDVASRQGGLSGRGYFDGSGKAWYELWNERTPRLLDVPKILSPEINDRPEFALVGADVYFMNSVTSATPSAESGLPREYVAGLLNSRVLALYHARHSVPKANGYLIYSPGFLERLPIKLPATDEERVLRDQIVEHVRALPPLIERRRGIVLDFRRYVEGHVMADDTLGGLISNFGPEYVEALSQDTGDLSKVSIMRSAAGELLILGRVRFHGTEYERGQFSEDVPLLRLRLPDPRATFLYRWIATGPPLAPTPRRGVWSLSAKARLIRVPTMTDQQRAEVLERYEPIDAEASEIDAEVRRREGGIESLVWRLYGLTDGMQETVRSSLLPSEMLGWHSELEPLPDEWGS